MRQQKPRPQRGEPWVDIGNAAIDGGRRTRVGRQLQRRERPFTKKHANNKPLARVGDIDAGAQPIKQQTPL